MQDQDTHTAFVKVLIAWVGTFVGTVTLQQLVLGLTAFYTLLQIIVLLRDRLAKRKERLA